MVMAAVLTAILMIVAAFLRRPAVIEPPVVLVEVPADCTISLVTQFTAVVRGSRAPPAASA